MSHVGGATCRTPPIPRSALEKDPRPGPLFEGNPVGEGTTRRGTDTLVHRPEKPAGSTYSSTSGLSPLKNSRGKWGFIPLHKTMPDSPVPTLQGLCDPNQTSASEVTRRTLRFLPPLEIRTSSIARKPVESREAPPNSQRPSPLRGTLGSFLRLLRPWGFSHEARRGPQGASQGASEKSGILWSWDASLGTPLEEGLSRSLSGGGGKPSCPSPSAGDLRGERPRFPGLPLRRTRGPDPSSKATLGGKAQHEGALPPPCIVRKDPRVPHTARRGA